MRKVTTIICSIAFMISGIMMAVTASDPYNATNYTPGTGYKTVAAATMPVTYLPKMPSVPVDTDMLDLPEDIIRDLAKKKGVIDTVYKDSIRERLVTKIKWRKAPAPKPIVMRDTIREAHYYLATQVGTKEGPTGKCISVYEVHEVDKICPDNINSSVKLMKELDNDVGE